MPADEFEDDPIDGETKIMTKEEFKKYALEKWE